MPEINRQFQSLHSPNNSDGVDWVLKQQVERDICLLYHQLADYSYIMGDLFYGDVYSLPYWQFLNWEGLTEDEIGFLREGCQVMILAMAWDMTDGGGAFLAPHLSECRRSVERLHPEETVRGFRLKDTVLLALDAANGKKVDESKLRAESDWVHREFVRGYFDRMAKGFQDNPYFQH